MTERNDRETDQPTKDTGAGADEAGASTSVLGNARPGAGADWRPGASTSRSSASSGSDLADTSSMGGGSTSGTGGGGAGDGDWGNRSGSGSGGQGESDQDLGDTTAER